MPDEVMYKPSKSGSHLYWAWLHHLLLEIDAMELRPISKLHQPFQVLPVYVLTIGPFDSEEDAIKGLYFFFASQDSEQKGRRPFTIEEGYDLINDVGLCIFLLIENSIFFIGCSHQKFLINLLFQ